MKKKIIIILLVLILITGGILFFLTRKKEFYSLEDESILLLKDKIEVYEKYKLSDIVRLDGERKILNDYQIDTDTLGKKDIELIYLDLDGDKRKGTISVEVVDSTPPYVGLGNHYTHYLGTNFTFYKDILCADNYDKHPKCEIIGEYNVDEIGETSLKLKAVDSNNNTIEKDFILKVIEKPKENSSSSKISFDEINSRLPSNASLLIDVSKWDKNIDWKKVKDAGIDYAMIRLGTQKSLDKESVIDPYFEKNIKGAKNAGIKVGIYYFSYANDANDAKEQAEWVVNQIKDYDLDLPICFDWESWKYFSEFDISIHDLNETARAFLDTMESFGYDTINYSSKNYLENVWNLKDYKTWLAHYTLNTNYQGDYVIWQFTDRGDIPGISGEVDVNFYYNK